MKIKGHPLHIMLIHFPVALLPMDLACSVVAYTTPGSHFAFAAFYALAGGVIFGWLAVVTGIADLVTWKPAGQSDEQAVISKGVIHGALQTTTIMIYTGLALLRWRDYPYLEPDSTGILIAKGVLVATLLVGNYFGGELLLKHYIRKKH